MDANHEHDFIPVHAGCQKCGRVCLHCGIGERELKIAEALVAALFLSVAEVA